MARTAERNEMLSDIWVTAVSCVRYWAEIEKWDAKEMVFRPHEPYEDGVETYTVTIDTISRGLRLCANGEVEAYNSGYEDKFKTRMSRLYRDKGPIPDEDYDAVDADIILQAGVFGELVYG